MDLYTKHRPQKFSEVYGQKEAVGVLKSWIAKPESIPHVIMLVGPSGCGKTTLARIFASELGCVNELSYQELNVSMERGVDMVNSLVSDYKSNILGGKRVWVLDEVQGVTKQAQQALLKPFEDAPSHAYFILCTTNPEKILPTLLTRCIQIKIQSLSDEALTKTLTDILEKENREVPQEVITAIIQSADGSARKAIGMLQKCLAASKAENMLKIVASSDTFQAVIKDLGSVFTSGKKTSWRTVAKLFSALDEDPETIRRAILGWVGSALEKGWARQVSDGVLAQIMRIFQFNTYDSGRPQLLLMVYDAWSILNK